METTATCELLARALDRIRSREDVPTPDLRRFAVQTGEYLQTESDPDSLGVAVELLHALASDWRVEVRQAAAQAALHLHTGGFDEIFARLSNDDYEEVRQTAAETLARRNGPPPPKARRQKRLEDVPVQYTELAAEHGRDVADRALKIGERHFEILASAANHEIRGVLTSLRGALDALGRRLTEAKLPPDIYHAHLTKAIERADFLRKIVDDMKGYAQELDCEFQRERLCQIIDEACDLAVDKHDGEHASPDRFELVNSVSADIALDASRYQLIQVFANVIKNAVEALEEQGQVVVAAHERDDGQVEVTITDNGVGMDEADLRDAFIIFKTSKKNEGGTGFGLPIARKIVQAHGGHMRLDSVDGKGTTAIIVLPKTHGGEQ